MRIDQSKFPSLFDPDIVISQYRGKLDTVTTDLFREVVANAQHYLFYISQTIMTPMLESYKKLVSMRSELKDSCRGLVFVSKRGNPHVFLYTMTHTDENRISIFCQISCMSGEKHYGSLFAGYLERGTDDTFEFYQYNHVSAQAEVVNETVRAILSAELFINFAEVETKTMEPSRQIWDGPRALYNNKTKFPITVVDSTWYTHLVSSGAFKVRGHFRLQPHGPELSQRKLIWISDFDKSGYTRKAKIETNGDN